MTSTSAGPQVPSTAPTVGGSNLNRWLAPVTEAAWTEIAEEARRTFRRNSAARRVVDVSGPLGLETASVNTGHLRPIEAPGAGIISSLREVVPLTQLRVPFTVSREAVEDVLRGAKDSEWQPVKDAATTLAHAEDRAVFQGYESAGIRGLLPSSSNETVIVPEDPRELPEAVAHGLTELRLAGVEGPYALVLDASLHTEASETRDHGYPIRSQLEQMVGQVVWAPAVTGAYLLSTRGGDFEMVLGQDVSIGYLGHDAQSIELYLQESFTFLSYTDEASVVLTRA